METRLSTRFSHRFARSLGVAAAVAAAVSLAACSAPAAGEPASAAPSVVNASVDQASADLVPAPMKSSGVLRVAIPTNEPPTQYYRDGTQELIGINPGVAQLVADTLGLKLQVVVTNFDAIIPGLSAGRYDMTVSSMTPTSARIKQLDFVDYSQMGSALAVQKGNPLKVSFEELCGRKIAFLKGSYQYLTYLPGVDKKCKAEGKPAVETLQFADTRQAVSALVSGRADTVYADQPILGYAALQEKKIEVAGENNMAPVAIGIPRDRKLTPAIQSAMKKVLASPEYKKLLEGYNLGSMAITDPRLNAAQG